MSTDSEKKATKPPTRQSVKVLSQLQNQDSPRDPTKMSSVKIAPVKEAKSLSENTASGDSRNLEREFSKFRDELKGMFLEQDKKISDKLQKMVASIFYISLQCFLPFQKQV